MQILDDQDHGLSLHGGDQHIAEGLEHPRLAHHRVLRDHRGIAGVDREQESQVRQVCGVTADLSLRAR